MRFLILLLFGWSLFGADISLCAQESPSTHSPFRIGDIYFLQGIDNAQRPSLSETDFRTLAFANPFLPNDLSQFVKSDYVYLPRQVIGLQLGLELLNKNGKMKGDPILRLGIQYAYGTNLNRSFTRETTYGSDTLTSQGTGQQMIIDSVNTRTYSIEYWYDQIAFDAELIFRTNSLARWSFFGGIGGVFGTSVNAYTQVSETDIYSIQFSGQNGYEEFSNSGYSSTTVGLDNARNYSSLFYVPLGVDFRIGTESAFWKKVHLFAELRPYYSSLHVPELRVLRAVGVQNLFGIRLNW